MLFVHDVFGVFLEMFFFDFAAICGAILAFKREPTRSSGSSWRFLGAFYGTSIARKCFNKKNIVLFTIFHRFWLVKQSPNVKTYPTRRRAAIPPPRLHKKRHQKIEQTILQTSTANRSKIIDKIVKTSIKNRSKSSKNHPWGCLGVVWGRLGSSWLGTVFVASWSHLRAVLGASWGV